MPASMPAIQGLHCTTGTRREKGMSMALDFKLLHYQPAAIPCDPSLNGRPGIGISQTLPLPSARRSTDPEKNRENQVHVSY